MGRPWRNPHVRPHSTTLRKWRIKARELAKAAGATTSCDLCKRPLARESRYGKVWLRPGNQWRARLMRRTICHSCYLILLTLVEDMEINGARDHLPPEDYADKPDEADEETEPDVA